MKDFAGDHDEEELNRAPKFTRASGYLDRRQQQILQSEQDILSLQRNIRNVTIDIAHLLVATPSAGNQAVLERSFGELKGLANAVAQTVAARSDGGTSRGADVDLTGIRCAIDSRSNSSSGSASKNLDDKTRNNATKLKELLALTPVAVSGSDQTAPEDSKPAGDAPASNLDRVNKLALEASGATDDQVARAPSVPAPLPNKPRSRSNIAVLKLDHTKVVVTSDAPDRQPMQGVGPPAQAASIPTKAEPVIAAIVRKPPSPAGM